jgi:cytochrome c peroxidase
VEAVKAPTFPRGSLVAPDGLILSSPGFRVGQQINAVAAWQNTLLPPKSGIENRSAGELADGRRIFAAAGCGSCHSGSALTNHQVIPVEEVKTQPSRAKALQKLPATFARQPSMWRSDMPTPLPADPVPVPVPTADISPRLIALAYAQGNNGGYKVPGLIGLKETAPYLHDGGVAAGKDAFQVGKDGRVTIANSAQLGLPGTVMKHVSPDPANSLRAFLDRRLRRAVVDANRKDASLRRVNNTGEGHPFWVDTASGFTDQDREALVKYLLSLSRPQE